MDAGDRLKRLRTQSEQLYQETERIKRDLKNPDLMKQYDTRRQYLAWRKRAEEARAKMLADYHLLKFEIKEMRVKAIAERAEALMRTRNGDADDPTDVLYAMWEELQGFVRIAPQSVTAQTFAVLDAASRLVEKKYPIR